MNEQNTIHYKTYDARHHFECGGHPCEEIIPLARALAPGEGLEVITPFLPSPLLEKMRNEGFASSTQRASDGSWHSRFYHDG